MRRAVARGMGHRADRVDALATLQPAVLDRMVRQAIAPFRDRTLTGRVDAARREWEKAAQAVIDEQCDRGALVEANERLDALRAHVAAEIEAINSLKTVDVDKLAFAPIVVPEAIDNSAWPRSCSSTRSGTSPTSARR